MANLPEPKVSQVRKMIKSKWDAPVVTGQEALHSVRVNPPIQLPAFRGGYAAQAPKPPGK